MLWLRQEAVFNKVVNNGMKTSWFIGEAKDKGETSREGKIITSTGVSVGVGERVCVCGQKGHRQSEGGGVMWALFSQSLHRSWVSSGGNQHKDDSMIDLAACAALPTAVNGA